MFAIFSVRALRLAMCALVFFGCASRIPANTMSAAQGGRLIIKRSVALGHNVSVAIYIDGKPAGTVRRNSGFERYLTPGRHLIVASPNRARGDWHGTLNVRPGETYSYTASYNVDKLVLTPAAVSR